MERLQTRTYTQVLHRDSAVEQFRVGEQQRGMKTTRDLPIGTVIAVEMGLTLPHHALKMAVLLDLSLQSSLHPRVPFLMHHVENDAGGIDLMATDGVTSFPMDDATDEMSTILQQKVQKNCFAAKKDGEATLYNLISAFNHCCKANCQGITFYPILSDDDDSDAPVACMYILTTARITAGSELTIMYGPDHGHGKKFDWSCNCGWSSEKRKQINKVRNGVADTLKDLKLVAELAGRNGGINIPTVKKQRELRKHLL
jgi:SET domain